MAYIEDVGITFDGAACMVRTYTNGLKIEIEFADKAYEWLTNPVMGVVSPTLQLPIGEINRHWLITKLNDFVEAYIDKGNEEQKDD